MIRLSVFTVATPELTPEQLAVAAKRAGVHGIEWRYAELPADAEAQPPSFWGNNRCTIVPSQGMAMVDRCKEATEAGGLATVSVTPYLQAGDLKGTERVLEVAARMNAAFIRLGVPRYDRSRPFGELFELERRYLREAGALCKRYGVKGLIETHHVTIAASASAAYRLCEGIDPDAVGVLYDPGNMVFEGFENYRMGLELLGPYLAHVHVKNAGWRTTGTDSDGDAAWQGEWTGLRHGMVPWKQVMEDLLAVGYDGYVGLEDFSSEYEDSASKLANFVSYFRKWCS